MTSNKFRELIMAPFVYTSSDLSTTQNLQNEIYNEFDFELMWPVSIQPKMRVPLCALSTLDYALSHASISVLENDTINSATAIKVEGTHLKDISSCKDGDAVLAALLCSSTLQKVITLSGNVYYGMKGMIMDESFTPLFMLAVDLEITVATLIIHNISAVISPKVFENPSSPLSKTIINKVIPIYMEDEMQRRVVNSTFGRYTLNSTVRPAFEIVIAKTYPIFEEVSKPIPDLDVNEDMANKEFDPNW